MIAVTRPAPVRDPRPLQEAYLQKHHMLDQMTGTRKPGD